MMLKMTVKLIESMTESLRHIQHFGLRLGGNLEHPGADGLTNLSPSTLGFPDSLEQVAQQTRGVTKVAADLSQDRAPEDIFTF